MDDASRHQTFWVPMVPHPFNARNRRQDPEHGTSADSPGPGSPLRQVAHLLLGFYVSLKASLGGLNGAFWGVSGLEAHNMRAGHDEGEKGP